MSSKSKYIRLIKDTGIFALGNLGSKLILFFLVPLYTNYMTTEEYGIADLISTLSELIMPFVSLVVFDAVQRFALSKDERSQDVLLCGLLTCCVGSLITFVITPLIGMYSAISEWKWFLSVFVVLSMFANVEKNYLKAKDQNVLFSVLSIIQTAVLATCNIVFLCLGGMGVAGCLLSTCIACSVPVFGSFAFGGLVSDLRNAEFDIELLKRMLTFSAPLILNNVSWWAIHSFDKVFLERIIGAAALGLYTVATKMPSLVNVMTSIFSQAWGISSVREYESSNDADYYSSVLQVLVLIVYGFTILLVSLIRPFMAVYVGRDFADAWRYVPLLLVAAAFYSVGSYYGSMYGALKKSVNNMITTFVSAAVCIVITVVSVPRVGVWGAIAGTLISYAVLMVSRFFDVRRFISVDAGGWRFAASTMIITVHAIIVSTANADTLVLSAVLIAGFLLLNYRTLQSMIRHFGHNQIVRR